jgi:transcriptional antiterminator RfaH
MINFRGERLRDSAWYILLCKPNQNHIAARHLKRMPVDVFMPYHMTSVRQAGHFRLQRRPLFAGYVFVGGELQNIPWRRIRATPGVSQVIGSDTRGPAQVPCDVIEGLVYRCDDEGTLQAEPDLSVGDRIKIMSGPFAEFVTRVEHIDAEQRVYALLDLLGAERRVAVDPRHITRLG